MKGNLANVFMEQNLYHACQVYERRRYTGSINHFCGVSNQAFQSLTLHYSSQPEKKLLFAEAINLPLIEVFI